MFRPTNKSKVKTGRMPMPRGPGKPREPASIRAIVVPKLVADAVVGVESLEVDMTPPNTRPIPLHINGQEVAGKYYYSIAWLKKVLSIIMTNPNFREHVSVTKRRKVFGDTGETIEVRDEMAKAIRIPDLAVLKQDGERGKTLHAAARIITAFLILTRNKACATNEERIRWGKEYAGGKLPATLSNVCSLKYLDVIFQAVPIDATVEARWQQYCADENARLTVISDKLTGKTISHAKLRNLSDTEKARLAREALNKSQVIQDDFLNQFDGIDIQLGTGSMGAESVASFHILMHDKKEKGTRPTHNQVAMDTVNKYNKLTGESYHYKDIINSNRITKVARDVEWMEEVRRTNPGARFREVFKDGQLCAVDMDWEPRGNSFALAPQGDMNPNLAAALRMLLNPGQGRPEVSYQQQQAPTPVQRPQPQVAAPSRPNVNPSLVYKNLPNNNSAGNAPARATVAPPVVTRKAVVDQVPSLPRRVEVDEDEEEDEALPVVSNKVKGFFSKSTTSNSTRFEDALKVAAPAAAAPQEDDAPNYGSDSEDDEVVGFTVDDTPQGHNNEDEDNILGEAAAEDVANSNA